MADVSQFIDSDEKVVAVVHRHWVNIFPIYLAVVIVFLAVLYGFYHLGRFGSPIPQMISSEGVGGILVVMLILLALITTLAGYVFLQNRIILTSKSLIQVTLAGILNETVSQFSLDHLQDVKADQSGLFPRMFGYGNILVETAGERENFSFLQVPDPRSVAALIMDLHEQSRGQIHPGGNGSL